MKRAFAIPRFAWLVILLMAGAVTAEDIRLANGKLLDDAKVKEINAEGMQLEMSGRTNLIPWRYLSAGTRFRFERPFLEKGGATSGAAVSDTNAPDKASSTNAPAKWPTTNSPATTASTNEPKEKAAPKASPAERLKQPKQRK